MNIKTITSLRHFLPRASRRPSLTTIYRALAAAAAVGLLIGAAMASDGQRKVLKPTAVPVAAQPAQPAPAPTLLAPTELQNLRIQNSFKDFELMQASAQQMQTQLETQRQQVIALIEAARKGLGLSADYQYDFKAGVFAKPAPAPAK